MDLRLGLMMSVASVAACTCSTVNSGCISVRTMPSGVISMTPISVIIISTWPAAVRGRVHSFKILGAPFWVCSIVRITRFAPTTRSIAPPIPGAIFPGIIQLARLPFSSTCNAPRKETLTWPPRMMAKDVAESKVQAPGVNVMKPPPALMRFLSSSPSAGVAPGFNLLFYQL